MLVEIEPLLKRCKEIYNSDSPYKASLIIREIERAMEEADSTAGGEGSE